MFEVRKIVFSEIRDYWIEVKHFHISNKIITETVTQLGPYKSKYDMENQKTQSYGLFDDNYIIGATQICEWDDHIIRWRSSNIREAYRSKGLFYNLLSTIIANDWSDKLTLIGWFRLSVMWWPLSNNFQSYDGINHDHDGDVYSMVTKPIKDICEDYNKRKIKLIWK